MINAEVIYAIPEKPIVDFSMGGDHMIFLTSENRLYALGHNDLHQCGQGTDDDYYQEEISELTSKHLLLSEFANLCYKEPIEVTNLHNLRIKQISAGDGHCLIKCSKV